MATQLTAETLIASMQQGAPNANDCLLSLFDILDEHLKTISTTNHPESLDQSAPFKQPLKDFLTAQAILLNASNPNILAEHILLIAQNAFNQQRLHPDAQSLNHAKKAAAALIQAQTNSDETIVNTQPFFSSYKPYAAIASIVCIGAAAIQLWPMLQAPTHTLPPPKETSDQIVKVIRNSDTHLSANEASAMYAQYDLMRSGTCRYLEAIQIPDKHKAIYIDSVVGGKLPTNLGDLAIANEYLEKISCNYTPMLMKKSK